MSVFGQIAAAAIPAVIGGVMGKSAAKYGAGANRYAVDQQMRPYNLKEPYYDRLYSGSKDALNNALAIGAYTGPHMPV